MAILAVSIVFVLYIHATSTSSDFPQCPLNGTGKLHFVAQLSVSGCPIFVHDTGAPDGPHLEVEPLMCVTESLHNVLPRYDPLTQQTYVSVSVNLRDDTILAEVKQRLRLLSPKSVTFAQVSSVKVTTDASSAIQALGFDWSQGDLQGHLRLGCINERSNCSGVLIALELRCDQYNVLDGVVMTASIKNHCEFSERNYRLVVQNQTLFDASLKGPINLPACKKQRFFRSIRVKDCTARVHQRLHKKGHFLIEPLLCHNVTSIVSESVMYDYSRDMHYLKLDALLQNGAVLNAVMRNLSNLSPRSIVFMQLWRAQSHVAKVLSRRFEVGGLMVSADGKSGQVRVYCRVEDDCKNLRRWGPVNPFRLWRHVKWSVTSIVENRCAFESPVDRYFSEAIMHKDSGDVALRRWMVSCRVLGLVPWSSLCHLAFLPEGRNFVVVQQRVSGNVSFQRIWAEYENGFGDQTDFWIGLSSIHTLSMNGTVLRIEMKLWNETELYAEYAGFKVGDATTGYQMTYREMLRRRSSVRFDSMRFHKEMKFSTVDKDQDESSSSCSEDWGRGGWWYSSCCSFNPNGLLASNESADHSQVIWNEMGSHLYLRELRIMLKI